MSITWAQMRDWKADGLTHAGDVCNKAKQTLLNQEDELKASAVPKMWEGEASEAAKIQNAKLTDDIQDLMVQVSALGTGLDRAAPRVQHIASMSEHLQTRAHTKQFEIGQDGAVRDLKPDDKDDDKHPDEKAQRENLRKEIEAQAKQILRTAGDIAHDVSSLLSQVQAGKLGDGDGSASGSLTDAAKTGAGVGIDSQTTMPPPKGDPYAAAAWWKTLGPHEQDWMIANRGGLLGNLRGLPYSVRGKANAARIPQLRDNFNDRLKQLHAELKDAHDHPWTSDFDPDEVQGKIDDLNDKMKALDALKGQALHHNTIISMDPYAGKRMRAAVAIGNLDTATHASFYTPGMNSTVENGGMDSYVKEMQETKKWTDQMLPGAHPKTAFVVNMDYEPPKLNPGETLDAAGTGRAQDGGKRLASELDGFDASRVDNPPQHTTVIGHSYGSTTTGFALADTHAKVDNALLEGSPGTGAPVEKMHVPEHEIYNLKNHSDPIAGPIASTGALGPNPSAGGQVMQLESGDATSAGGRHLYGSDYINDHSNGAAWSHTSYTEADGLRSTDEYNTAALCAGRDNLTIAPKMDSQSGSTTTLAN